MTAPYSASDEIGSHGQTSPYLHQEKEDFYILVIFSYHITTYLNDSYAHNTLSCQHPGGINVISYRLLRRVIIPIPLRPIQQLPGNPIRLILLPPLAPPINVIQAHMLPLLQPHLLDPPVVLCELAYYVPQHAHVIRDLGLVVDVLVVLAEARA